MAEEEYLGDGLYASFDGFGFKLRAPRGAGDHWVYLEWEVLDAFDRYRKQIETQRSKHD
jgi:hypothetical protein